MFLEIIKEILIDVYKRQEVGRGESKHPSLPLARAERKPLDRKKKLNPRHQRENLLKEKQALLQQCSAPTPQLYCEKSIFNLKECKK